MSRNKESGNNYGAAIATTIALCGAGTVVAVLGFNEVAKNVQSGLALGQALAEADVTDPAHRQAIKTAIEKDGCKTARTELQSACEAVHLTAMRLGYVPAP